MPAYNPGSPLTPVTANPSVGKAVTMSPFSGPKGSPFDAKAYPPGIYQPVLADRVADPNNVSTGALSTGIGFGLDDEVPGISAVYPVSAVAGKQPQNFTDDYTPGVSLPSGVAATTAILTAIGGGKSTITVTAGDYARGVSTVSPYVAQPILAFGNGGLRDAGAGPAFTGFGMKTVTATGTVANGAAIEAGFANRSGVSLTTGNSQFGSNGTASPAVT